MTNLAADHVLEHYDSWPTYPEIDEYGVPVIKTLILMGKINNENEWRLNEQTSIRGGITFLKYLEDYWHRPENRAIVERIYKDDQDIYNDIILSSYNSGAYRTKKAMIKYGKSWLSQDDELGEAKKYVRRVKSYCYQFSNEEAQ